MALSELERRTGLKHYELTDHLGNVRVVVSDLKLSLLSPSNEPSDFSADMVSKAAYFAFGSLLPGRNYSSDSYRYGFNTQEKDDEIYGAPGTSYSAKFWQYDSRIARRWNLDPITVVGESPYATFKNNPIRFTDPEGDTAKDKGKGNGNPISRFFRGIVNKLKGRPWNAKHKLDLGPATNKRKWGNVRNSGGMVSDEYIANLEAKEKAQEDLGKPENLIRAAGYKKLRESIIADFDLIIEPPRSYKQNSEEAIFRRAYRNEKYFRGFLAPEIRTFQGVVSPGRIQNLTNLKISQNQRELLNGTGPTTPSAITLRRVRSGDVIRFEKSLNQPAYGDSEYGDYLTNRMLNNNQWIYFSVEDIPTVQVRSKYQQ